MTDNQYRYLILRYVADLRRMEPQNIGVIVQGEGGTLCRLWSHFCPVGHKADFDFANYRQWREFFDQEVNGPPVPLFQPPKHSVEFLEYLRSRCEGNYVLSRPLELAAPTHDLEEIAQYLYDTLVKPADKISIPAEQPVRHFRETLKARKLDKNPFLQKDGYVEIPGSDPLLFDWQFDRNHGSNQKMLIEQVQWTGEIKATQHALQYVVNALRSVRDAKLNANIAVVMDEVTPPDSKDRDANKRLYDNYVDTRTNITKLADEIVDSAPEVEDFVDRLDRELTDLVTA